MSSTANYSSNNLSDNYILNGLYKQNWNPSTFLIDQKYAVITMLTEKLSTPIYTQENDGKFHWAQLGNLGVTATIATSTANAINSNWIDVTWTDPTYDDIRVTEIWLSGTQTLGRVVSHTPGRATFQPVGPAFTSSDFTAGSIISFNFTATPSYASGPTENRWYTPTQRIGYVGVTREDRNISRRQLKVETWVTASGQKMWNYAQQPLMVQEANKEWETRILLSKPYNNGTYQTSIGLLDEIRNYGQHMPLYDIQNMETKLIEMIEQLAIFGGSKTSEYIVLTGTKGLGLLQTGVFKQYILYPGQQNTLKVNGKEFEGINATTYAYSGITLHFIKYDLLDDPKVFPLISTITGAPLFSNTMIFLDPSPIMTMDGERSAFQKVIFGESGTPEYGSYVVTGLMGKAGGGDKLGDIGRDYDATANAIDGAAFGIWKDSGVYFPNVQAFGLMELAY
jgi:hypothetical protein